MLTNHTIKTTLHALIAAIENMACYNEDEQAFLHAYHASLNAGATTKADDEYFFCFLMKRLVAEDTNYGGL